MLEFLNYKKPKRKLYILLIFACQALGKLLYKIKTRVVISGILISAFRLWDRWSFKKKTTLRELQTECSHDEILFCPSTPSPFPLVMVPGHEDWMMPWRWSPHEWGQCPLQLGERWLPSASHYVRTHDISSLRPGRRSSPNHAGTLISSFKSPELWGINFCCL